MKTKIVAFFIAPFAIVVGLAIATGIFSSAFHQEAESRQVWTGEFTIKQIANCEYVIWRYSQAGGITHKGDCPNPIHKHRR